MTRKSDMQTQTKELKAVAKAMGRALKNHGHPVPHGVLLHALGASLGKSNWHALRASLEAPTMAAPQGKPARDPVTGTPQVFAEFWTDDHVFEVRFEANAWLAQASDDALAGVFQCGFRGDYATDEIGMWEADRNTEIAQALAYLDHLGKSPRRAIGFEVAVAPGSFCGWLAAHRPAVLATALCEHYEVMLVPAAEAELAGTWDWLGTDIRGKCVAGTRSFDSKTEAAEDATAVLELQSRFLDDGCS